MHSASRAPTKETFESYWARLHAGVRDAGKLSDKVQAYLGSIYRVRERWAFCYRTGVLTLGINATQRCEGFFGKLKEELRRATTLYYLLSVIDRITKK
jgi:hypothetical protein